ncbi:MAG TPA: efflux RND transporter periplasmic adaptor subunit [Opitutaceae bacterium]|nr:efflux RND transporter periplasmic adaptor subunit [Opitutaceae bacterium]
MNPPPAVTKPAIVPTVSAPRKKSPIKWILLGAAALLVVLVIAAYVVKKNHTATVRVTAEKSVTRTIIQVVSATGKVQPELEVKIAPEVAGEITQLPFREGALVKKGDLLVSIKPDNYRFQVEQAQAALASARASALDSKARLEQARADFQRNDDLYQKHLISDSDYITAKTTYEAAEADSQNSVANIQRAEGVLNQAEDLLKKTMIYSPISGTVTSLSNEVGERVAATGQYGMSEVMRVADLSNMEVEVNVNENDIVNVKVGDKAKISIDAFPGRKFIGVVKEIGAAAKVTGQNTQDEVTNFLVKIRILDKDVALRPSMSANADIETKTVENAVAVPIQSVTVRSKQGARTMDQVTADRQKSSAEMKGEGAATAVNVDQQKRADREDRESMQRGVFEVVGDKVKWVPVETGVQDTNYIEIKSGLKAGEEVVSGSFGVITRTLKDGMAVTVDRAKRKS